MSNISMPKIIPVINAKTIEAIKDKIKKAREFSDWVHLDVASKEFTSFETWHNPVELELIEKDGLKIELHLMIPLNRNSVRPWLREGVKRVVFQIEQADDPASIIKVLKKEKREVGLALMAETPLKIIEPYLEFIDQILVLAITPGSAGEKIESGVMEKYRKLSILTKSKLELKDLKIEADGGINKDNIGQFALAGANIISSGTAIFKNGNPEENFKELQNLAGK